MSGAPGTGRERAVTTQMRRRHESEFSGFACGGGLSGAGRDRDRAVSDRDHRHRAAARRVRPADEAGAGNGTSVAVLRGDGDCFADGGPGVCRSAQHSADAASADTGGAQRSAEGAGLADQLQPVRHGSGDAAEPVRVSAGEGPGGCGGRGFAHARRGAVERQRHLAEHSNDGAVFRRDRADRGRRQHAPPSLPRRASWTG